MERLINLTNVQLNKGQVELLRKSIQYAALNKINKEDILIKHYSRQQQNCD